MCAWQGGPARAEGRGLSMSYIPRLGASDSWSLLPVSQSIRSLGPLDNIHYVSVNDFVSWGIFFEPLFIIFPYYYIYNLYIIYYIKLLYYNMVFVILYNVYILYMYIIIYT